MTFADIILPLPLEGYFTYSVPPQLQVTVGVRVLVPFGSSKKYVGIVAKVHNEKPGGYEVKDVLQVMDAQPIVLPAQLRLWHWMADYYMSPIGEVFKAALPSGLKAEEGYHPRTETYIRLTPQFQNEATLHVGLNMLARAAKQQEAFIAYLALSHWDTIEDNECREPVVEITREELINASGATLQTVKALQEKGFLETYEVEVGRLNHGGTPHPELIKKLSIPQQDAYNKILLSMMQKRVTLLHGVTSSGKTEIYIHLIQRELEQKRQVLYLLPEIALTVQMMDRLRRVFGSRLGIYHSRYSDAERVEIWQKQLSPNPYDIILGARSAVFLPFQRLGLVIVDEEHETSYKQQDPMPRYHARSAAIMLTAPSNLPQLGEAPAAEAHSGQGRLETSIIDYYKTADPVNYALLRQFSIENRKNPTEAEMALWEMLKGNNLDEKFRRQHIIGDFIVDFVCLRKKLVIEIDGGYHFTKEQQEADRLRTSILHDMGFLELRFTNEQVLFSPNNVLSEIKAALSAIGKSEVASAAGASPSWGRLEGASVLLGTATPSMETYHNARTGKYGLVELTERYQGIELPEIQVVDVQDLRHRKMMRGPFSPLLMVRVREALESGKQAILFQNRRGWAPMVMCRQCGWVPHCEHCDVSLTLHRTTNQLSCHYCGYTYRVPTECPACGSKELQGRGYGTEKIEDQIRDLLPDARIARMDLDTTRTHNAYERIISDFATGRTNLLIGTQMISKGLDFDRVAVVGILDADAMLCYPDFRAYEHAYMMMSQVSGRAGRKGKRGFVILQTRDPNQPVIQHVVRGDFQTFYRELIAERQTFHYPPYYRLIYVYLKHKSDAVADIAGQEMGSRLRQWFGGRVLGPDKPPVARVKALCIRKLVLKLENGLDVGLAKQYLHTAQQQMMQEKRYASLQIYYDVDPL